MQKRMFWLNFLSLIASLISLSAVIIPLIYLNIWYLILAAILIPETLISILSLTHMDVRVWSVFEMVHVFIVSLIVIIFVIAPAKQLNYYLILGLLVLSLHLKLGVAIWEGILYIKTLDISFHAYSNHNINSSLILLQIILFIFNSLLITDGNFFWWLIIDIAVNFIVTNITITLAAFMLVELHFSKDLGFIQKIVLIIKTLINKGIFFYIGMFFMSNMALIAFIHGIKENWDLKIAYFSLAIYYLVVTFIRLFSHIRKNNPNKFRPTKSEATKDANTALITSILLFITNGATSFAMLLNMKQSAESNMPLWWFFLFMAPISIIRGISAFINLRKQRKGNNIYEKAMAVLDIVTASFAVTALMALIYHYFSRPILLLIILITAFGFLVYEVVLIIWLFVNSIIAKVQANRLK